MATETPENWTERSERKPVDLRGFALGESLDADIIVADVSYEGCGIESPAELSRGDKVELRIISRGRALGEVRWVDGKRAGVRFLPND